MRLPFACLAFLLLSPTIQAESVLRIGLQDDPDQLDPAQGGTYAGRIVFASLCDKLVDIDAKLNFVPQLATAWSWSPDARTLSLTLREGVMFHDGTPLDAAAVRANIERARTAPESVRKAELKSVTAIDVVDPRTIAIKLAQPFAPLLAVLSDRAGMMMAPTSLASGRDAGRAPICSGPFRFIDRVPLDHITLDRFPGYWNAQAIHVDRVVFRPIPDSTVRFTNLQSGALDLIEEMAPSDAVRAKAIPGLRVLSQTSLGYETIAINVGHAPGNASPLGQDPRVREAFESAIDREALNTVALEGLFVPDNQAELPQSRYFDAARPVPPRDIERAKALLKAAGVARLTVALRMSNTPREIQIGEVLQSMLADAGIELKVLPTETNAQIAAMNAGDFQASIVNWSGRADPDANISLFLASDGFQNWGKYANPAFDDLLSKGRAETDPDQRAPIYRRIADTYLSDRPDIFLFHPALLFATSDKVTGFSPLSDGLIRPQGISIAP